MEVWVWTCGEETGINNRSNGKITQLIVLLLFRWEKEFEENHVLVMTAQVFVDVLNHAFFSPHKLNLLVFDECHAGLLIIKNFVIVSLSIIIKIQQSKMHR